MSKALSLDLRNRVLSAVSEGMSHRAAGARFGVALTSIPSNSPSQSSRQGSEKPLSEPSMVSGTPSAKSP